MKRDFIAKDWHKGSYGLIGDTYYFDLIVRMKGEEDLI